MNHVALPDPLSPADLAFIDQLKAKSARGELGQDQQDLLDLLLKVHSHAFRDELTGLYNRKVFNQEAAKRYPRRATQRNAVLMIDINDFKEFNTKYGHPGGDVALKHVATIIGQTVRDTDIAVRYAGDEFCVIARDVSDEGVGVLAKRLYDAVKASPVELDGQMVPLTISIGYAEITRGINDAFMRADRALLDEAKLKKDTEPTIAGS
jgi:diguanylate cyclase (GGDEF)-like protein